jgi:hypothetical protein
MMSYSALAEPANLRSRETHLYEVTLEHVFKRPFAQLVQDGRATTGCTERDLLQLGKRIYQDFIRVARGEISSIEIPARMPRAGEYAEAPPPAATG